MARRSPPVPPSAATGGRVRRSRSEAANRATRALVANVAALEALGSKAAMVDRVALCYLEAWRPTSVFAPAHLDAADQIKLAHIQGDQIVGVIRAVLEGLKVSDDDYTRGIDLVIKELRAASSQGWEPL